MHFKQPNANYILVLIIHESTQKAREIQEQSTNLWRSKIEHKKKTRWTIVALRYNSQSIIKSTDSNPESSAVPSTPRLLKLPPLGSDVGLRMAVWHTRSSAKVLYGFPCVLRTSQENLYMSKLLSQQINCFTNKSMQ